MGQEKKRWQVNRISTRVLEAERCFAAEPVSVGFTLRSDAWREAQEGNRMATAEWESAFFEESNRGPERHRKSARECARQSLKRVI